MNPLTRWKLKTYAKLYEVPPDVLKHLENLVDGILVSSIPPTPVLIRPEVNTTKPEVENVERSEVANKIDPGPPVIVTSPFGERVHPISGKQKHHGGVDLAMKRGDKVYAIGSGIVRSSFFSSSFGNYVSITHDNLEVAYAHLDKRLVKKGQRVNAGDVVGLVGKTGSATGNHLHLIVRDLSNGKRLSPREPTSFEMSKAIGGRELNWGRHKKHAHLEIIVVTGAFPLTKVAVQISIEPYYSVIRDAITEIESKQPGYFQNVNKIVVEPGSPNHFGKVQSDSLDTIFISLDKIKSAVQNTEDEDQVRAVVIETLTHEMGHLNSNFEGGEAPAEAESTRMQSFFQ